MSPHTAPRIGELFAGYGGLGLAVRALWPDAQLAWYSDVCKFDKDGRASHYEPHRGPCRVMAHHHPDVPNLGDVAAVDWTAVERVDILTGGSPCQDLSHAGSRAGMTEGTRSNLWVAMREAIATLRPGLVIWENVRGAYTAAADSALEPCPGCMGEARDGQPVLRALGRVLGDLSELGYDAGWVGLRAADVGAAHNRYRVFVVAWPAAAHPDNAGRGEHRWPLAVQPQHAAPQHGGAAAADRVTLLPTPVVSDTNGPGQHGDGGADLRTAVSLLPTPAVNDMGEGKTVEKWDEWTDAMKAQHGNGNGHGHGKSLAIEAQRLLQTPSVADALGGHERRGGKRGDELLLNGQVKAYAEGKLLPATTLTDDPARQPDRWGDYAAAIHRWEQVLGRPTPAPTQTSTKGNPQLAPAFTEWLMGLPEGHITAVPGITRNEALKLCGNGVVPQQAAEAVRWLLGHAMGGAR